jgi:beta-glucosidase-like glycosyl hydrolase/serine/threonine protein kinase
MRRMPLANGATIAGFTIVRLLGSGGTGEVYLAEHPRLPQRVALKILRADVSADLDFQHRFERDVDLAATLEHPCLARVLDRGVFDGRLWLATEYINGLDTGRSLRERYPSGMTPRAVLIVVNRIADALDFAHQRELLHRHVKPGNILLDTPDSDAYRILLTDFGTARRLDTLRELSTATGPDDLLAYAAPEELTGNDVDGRADQYGLAATAFHLLTGNQPGRARQNPPSRLVDTRSDLADLDPVIARALAVDPTARFASSAEFATALARAGERIPAGSGPPPAPPGPASRPLAPAGPPSTGSASSPVMETPAAPDTSSPTHVPPEPVASVTAKKPGARRSVVVPTVLALVAAAVLVVAGVLLSKPRPPPSQSAPASQPAAAPTPTASAPLVPPAVLACGDPRVAAAALLPRDKLAQLLMVGVTGADDARAVVMNEHVGGIFIGSWTDLTMLKDGSLHALAAATGPLPLAVSVDEEGGRVERLSSIIGEQPAPRVLAKTQTVQQVHDIALQRGRAMKDLGITVDFAPVVDVTDAQDDTVIGDRSFSANPETVVEYAGAYAQGLREAGLLPVLKHFPGHGHASGDSHKGGVTTPPLDDLKDDDLIPYRTLTTVNPIAVMVGHLQVPGLTGTEPASLSKAAYDLLRSGQYGGAPFPGLVFTDDLSSMGAINQRYSVPDAVLRALQAGADTALWITTDQVPAVLDRLVEAVNTNELSMDRVNEALNRVALGKGPHPNCGR